MKAFGIGTVLAVALAAGCGRDFEAYRMGNRGTEAPILLATDPPLVTDEDTVDLIGSAPAGTTVQLYLDPECAVRVGPSGVSNADNVFRITVSGIRQNETLILYVRAQSPVVSACSATGFRVRQNRDGPKVPVIVGPDSTQSVFVRMRGEAEDGQIVRIYRNSLCDSRFLMGEGTASDFNEFGILLSQNLDPGRTTLLYTQASDSAENRSRCSPSGFLITHQMPTACRVVLIESTRRIFCAVQGVNGPGIDGDEHCASMGLRCTGVPRITAGTSPYDVCHAFHPEAERTSSDSGSHSVFYCSGADEGLACPGNVPACHDCPPCTTTFDCNESRSMFFGEWYAECAP